MPDDLGLNLEDVFNAPANTPADGATLPPDQPQVTPDAPTSDNTAVTPPDDFSSSSLFLRAQQAGLPLDGIDSPDKFQEFLLDQLVQAKPYADYGRSALTNPTTVSDTAQERDVPPQDEVQDFDEDKYFSEAWTVPQLSPGAQMALKGGAFETDDRGFIVAAKGYEQFAMPYLKEINDYQQAKAQQNESFASNPVKFMAEKLLPYFEHKFSGKFQNLTEQRFQEYQQQNFEDKFIEQNKSWLYTPDGKAFTSEGVKFRNAIQDLRAKGITDPETLADWGLKLAGVNPTAAAAPASNPAAPAAGTPPAPPADTRVRDEQGRFLPAGTPAPAPTKQESFLDEVKRKAAGGANQGGRAGDSDFVVANEGELDNMFTTAWREYAGAK